MTLHIVIPARYGSTRFPGKPLVSVAGVPLLQRVWALGVSAMGTENVVVATDDDRIAAFCLKIGARFLMTEPALANGTLRVRAALQQLPNNVRHAVNLQGDAVLTPPWVLQAVLAEMRRDPASDIVTPATAMSATALAALRAAKAGGDVGGTTVVFDQRHDALYFSKNILPYVRDNADVPVYRHIGLYGYHRDALERFVALPEGPLERAEKLEQLRALEHGMKIRVVPVDYRGRSHTGIDSPADVARAEELIAAEGELLPVYDGSYRGPS